MLQNKVQVDQVVIFRGVIRTESNRRLEAVIADFVHVSGGEPNSSLEADRTVLTSSAK